MSEITDKQKEIDKTEKKEYNKENGYNPLRPRRKHILIVDDDIDQLIQIKSHLLEFYDVTAVRSGHDALKYLEKHNVDLMLLDYKMPEMDGPTIISHIRSSAKTADLPVVFLTGISDRETVLNAIVELKPQGYLVKPAKKSEIVAKIIDVLG